MRKRFIYCSGRQMGHIVGYNLCCADYITYYIEIKCDLESVVTRGLGMDFRKHM